MSQKNIASTSNELTDEFINMYTINMFKTISQLTALKIPIKKTDLVAIALNGNNKYFNQIFSIVTKELKQIYGYTVNTVNDKKNGLQYFCTTNLPRITSPHISEYDQSKETLLFLCLSYIFMKDGSVSEENVLEYIQNLGITIEEEHEYFGNVKKQIQDTFVKELYFKKTKTVDEYCNTTKTLLSWGQRSEIEVSKKDVLEFVAKTLDANAKYFLQQYNEVYVDADKNENDSDNETEAIEVA